MISGFVQMGRDIGRWALSVASDFIGAGYHPFIRDEISEAPLKPNPVPVKAQLSPQMIAHVNEIIMQGGSAWDLAADLFPDQVSLFLPPPDHGTPIVMPPRRVRSSLSEWIENGVLAGDIEREELWNAFQDMREVIESQPDNPAEEDTGEF